MESTGPYHLARVDGRIALEHTDDLVDRLQPYVMEPRSRLVIDMSQVTSIDSSGLSTLIGLVTRARMHDGQVLLVAPNSFVTGVLEVTRLNDWFDICEDLDEADRRMR